MKIKNRSGRVLSLILILLLSFSVSVPVISASDDASIIAGYKLISSPVKVTAPTYAARSPWTTFTNSSSITDNYGVVYRVDFPDMTGREFRNFIFRFGTSYYGGSALRVMGLSASYDVPGMSYTDEPFASMWANEAAYNICDSAIVTDNFLSNYYMNYADITTYANECLAKGASHMYIVVNSHSTGKAFSSDLADTSYIGHDLYPYYYYDSKFIQTSDPNPTVEGYKKISDPVLITGTTYAPKSPWQTFTNSYSVSENQGVLYRIDLPELNGKEFKNFIFRFGSSYYGGSSMRVMGVSSNLDIPNMSYTDEPFASMWADEASYTSNAGEILSESPASNYYINYADLTGYANECVARGNSFMYVAVNSRSTAKAFGSDIKDSDYRRYDLFPYYYYDTRDLTPTTANVLKNINARIASGKMTHPYLHGSMENIEQIRANLESGDKWTTEFYAKLKKDADALVSSSPKSYGIQVSQSYSVEENIFLNLMIAYHIEGDEKYLNRAIAEFEMLMNVTDWTADAQLDNTQTGASISVGYDWLYDYLTEEQRLWAETNVKEKVLSIGYRYYQDPSCLTQLRQENDNMNIVCGKGTYNHNTHNNANLLVCALALAPLNPEYSAFVISNNFNNIVPYLELVGTNGGHEEPIGYYSYTSTKICSMLSASNAALGTMYGYETYPGFQTTAYYPMQMYGAGPFSIGDSGHNKGVYNSNPLYFFAKESKDTDLMGILASRYENGGVARMLLWYDKGELDNIDLSKRLSMDAHLYPTSKGQNIAAFRDNWDIDKGFYAAMYTGCASANGHSDAVSGAFCIDAFGERFVTPIGIGNYSYTNYWDHAQNGGRWVWYEKRPEGGNCLVINPAYEVGQNVTVTAVMDEFESSEGTAYAITDLSEVYGDYVTEYKRGMLISDNRSTITVQDEAKMKEPSEIFWSINTMAKIDIVDNETAILTNNGKKVMVKIFADIDYNLYKMKAEKLPTSPQSDLQRDYPGFSKLAISAENVSEMTLSVKFYPLANDHEWKNEEFSPVSMNSWSIDEDYEEKPTLEAIYVDGEALEGFEPDRYNYELEYGVIPDVLPEIEAVSDDYEVSVTYPKNGKVEALVAVKGKTRTAYYTINFKQTTTNLTSTTKALNYSKFTTSTYNLADDTSVGTNASKNYLYASKVYYHHYAVVDISSITNTDVTSATYTFTADGSGTFSIYEVEGDFTPGVTTAGELPASGAPIATVNIGDGGRFTVDITDYAKRLAAAGKTKLGFVVSQTVAGTAWIGSELSTSSSRPSLSVTYRPIVEPLVISDIKVTTSSLYKKANVKVTNNSDLCFGEYIFFGASYDGDKLTTISVSDPMIVMPYRSKEFNAQLPVADNVKFFLWRTNCRPVKMK